MFAYAITDPKIFWEDSEGYIHNLKQADWVLYRDKESNEYAKRAKAFIALFSDNSSQLLLHQDYRLAKELGVWGVHLTSKQFSDIGLAKELGLFTVISTHSFEEIALAQKLGADAATFSPIFPTPGKGEAKGVERLKEAVATFELDIIALGGIIGKEEIELIQATDAAGFASIRYFVNTF